VRKRKRLTHYTLIKIARGMKLLIFNRFCLHDMLRNMQKRSRGNQLIHRRYSKTKSIGGGSDPENPLFNPNKLAFTAILTIIDNMVISLCYDQTSCVLGEDYYCYYFCSRIIIIYYYNENVCLWPPHRALYLGSVTEFKMADVSVGVR